MPTSKHAEPTPTQQQCEIASEMFDHFVSAGTQKMILGLHREICNCLNLKPNRLSDFYPKLKAYLAKSWRAVAVFKKFDLRASQNVYSNGRACSENKVLIIGAGPAGLRTAIECQLLGAKVVVVEKRDRMSRNNVLHLWPFVIEDLRALGAKQFFGKFCAGDINHISIRQLQCILLKVALLLGVEFHESLTFQELLEPTVTPNSEVLGWRARLSPEDHPASQYEFDVLIGADGKRNTLQNFKRTEFRGKLALAITANFINRRTEQEASVPEISGVSFIFRQEFFKDMNRLIGIDLENIVYYKDDTHYFVMTAKKHSLLSQGVLKHDYADVAKLLSVDNVDRDMLIDYARRAANYSTDGKLPLDFALNHYGDPDVALFDFTSMYYAENASTILERKGRRLLCQLVGDSLSEPFWPTGSGCARGFLSSFDASWAIRSFGQIQIPHPLKIIAERESVYRLLAQTTPENLSRDLAAYTIDPATRYPNLNRTFFLPESPRVMGFYDSDNPLPLDKNPTPRKRKRAPEVNDEVLIAWVGYWIPGLEQAASADAVADVVRRYRPDLLPPTVSPKLVYTILQKEFTIQPFSTISSTRNVPIEKLRHYLQMVYNHFKGEIPHLNHQTNYFEQLKQNQQKEKSSQGAGDIQPSAFTAAAEAHKKKRRSSKSQAEARAVGSATRTTRRGNRIDQLAANLSRPTCVYNIEHPSKPKELLRAVGRLERDDWNVKEIERRILENRLGRPEPGTAERVPKWDKKEFLDRQKRLKEGSNDEKWSQTDETFRKIDRKRRDSGRPELGSNLVANLAKTFSEKYLDCANKLTPVKEILSPRKIWERPINTGMTCASCSKSVFAAEAVSADGIQFHRSCFRCAVCKTTLRPGNYTTELNGVRLVCLRHGGISVPDTAVSATVATTTAVTATAECDNTFDNAIAVTSPVQTTRTVTKPPERISIRLSTGSTKIDEDEWTDRNFLPSETSGAGGLSDISESSSEEDDEEVYDEDAAEYDDAEGDHYGALAMIRQQYTNPDSDDSFGYDDASDDVVGSSGNESCSRMREAREARRKEVPTAQLPPTDSSEVESDEESDSSSEEVSSATEVSTDSEFAREEIAVQPSPPAILVTEPIPPPPPPRPQDYPLSRTRSAGGLATKRALELKRRYLLGEPSPQAVRKSDSTSQLDTKIEAFRTNITEFQKMLHPAPIAAAPNITVAFHVNVEKPPEEVKSDRTLDSDSLSEDSHTQRMPNQTVPIVEVHNEGGELIEHNRTLINISTYNADEKVSGDISGTTVVAAESESSESCRDATTLALTETELSDWAAESVVLDDCGLEDKEDPLNVLRRSKNPRKLSGPKIVHDAKNVTALSSHVCGRTSPEKVMFSNALEYFEFADEGDQDPSIEKSEHPVNEGFMEIVHEFDHDSPKTEPKNFIESFSEMIVKPNSNATNRPDDSLTTYISKKQVVNGTNYTESFNSDLSPPLEHSKIEDFIDTPKRTNHNKTNNNEEMISPPLTDEHYHALSKTTPCTFRVYSPAICRSRSENFHHLNTTHSMLPRTEHLFANTPPLTSESSCTVNSNANDIFLSPSIIVMSSETSSTGSTATSNNSSILSPRAYSMPSTIEKSSGSLPSPQQNKVLEINKDRQKQMEVVRGLVLERLGNGPRLNRRCSKRPRMTVVSNVPPPVPPLPTYQMTPPQTPPSLDTCLPPPRPAPPVMPLPVMPSFSDPELTKEKRNKSFLNSITKYLNRRFKPRDKWPSESDLLQQINRPLDKDNKSTGALEELALPLIRLSAVSTPPSSSSVPDTIQTSNETPENDDDSAAEKEDEAPRCYVTFRKPNRMQYLRMEVTHEADQRIQTNDDTEDNDDGDGDSSHGHATHTIQGNASVIIISDSGEEEEDDAPPSPGPSRRPNRGRRVVETGCTQDPKTLREARKNVAQQNPTRTRRAVVQKKLSKQTSAEGQAEAVAEYLQVKAQRGAHRALKAADEKRRKPNPPQ